MKLVRWIFLILILAAAGWIHAAGEIVAVPALSGRIVDLTSTLTTDQVERLNAKLQTFERRGGSQIAVLLIPTTQSEPIEAFSIRVADVWKLGRRKIDDGAILVIVKNDRTARLEVGYGLEGVLNDATSKRIIDEVLLPHIKANDYFSGIDAGLDAVLKAIDGEALPVADTSPYPPMALRELLPVALVIAVVLGSLLRSVFGRVPGAAATGLVIGAAAWFFGGALVGALIAAAVGFFFTLAGRGGLAMVGMALGGGNGSRSGSGGGGGFSGGGGGFGGGGASGRW